MESAYIWIWDGEKYDQLYDHKFENRDEMMYYLEKKCIFPIKHI